MKYLLSATLTATQLCQMDLDYKAQIIQKQHFEIEQLKRESNILYGYEKHKLVSKIYNNTKLQSELDGL